jgi:hypothetical protein
MWRQIMKGEVPCRFYRDQDSITTTLFHPGSPLYDITSKYFCPSGNINVGLCKEAHKFHSSEQPIFYVPMTFLTSFSKQFQPLFLVFWNRHTELPLMDLIISIQLRNQLTDLNLALMYSFFQSSINRFLEQPCLERPVVGEP